MQLARGKLYRALLGMESSTLKTHTQTRSPRAACMHKRHLRMHLLVKLTYISVCLLKPDRHRHIFGIPRSITTPVRAINCEPTERRHSNKYRNHMSAPCLPTALSKQYGELQSQSQWAATIHDCDCCCSTPPQLPTKSLII